MPKVIRDIFFQGVAAPLRIDDADAVLPLMAEVASGWPHQVASGGHPSPFFSITGRPGEAKLCCVSHVEDRPPQDWDPVNAVCDALAALAIALPQSDPRLLCLHAAGVEVHGALVIFPNIRRAGKSTLSVALAQSGHRIFSDDVVPLSFPQGGSVVAHAMGIAPRLRLPLPESLPAAFRAWAEGVPGPRNRQYHYLPLPGQPAHGDRLRVGAFVLLDRRDQAVSAQLVHVAPDAAMDALLHQNFTRDRHSGEVLDAMAATLAEVPVLRLVFSDLDEALVCLEKGLPDWSGGDPPHGTGRQFREPNLCCAAAPLGSAIIQREGCVARLIGDMLYLADPEGRAIHRMDPLAAAVWAMLEEGATVEELEETLGEAFPDTPRDRIAADLFALLAGLAEAGLVGDCETRPD